MTKYKVLITESIVHSVIVEASSEEEARSAAYDHAMNDGCEFAVIDYAQLSEGTTHMESWKLENE